MYPLADVYITIENHHFHSCENSYHHFDWAIFEFAKCKSLPGYKWPCLLAFF